MSTKTGVLFIGVLGKVATTTIAGIFLLNKKIVPLRGIISEDDVFTPLRMKPFNQFVFGGWDIRGGLLSEQVKNHGIVRESMVDAIESDLNQVTCYPSPAMRNEEHLQSVYDVKSNPVPLKKAASTIEKQINSFKEKTGVDQVIVINTGPTEQYTAEHSTYQSLNTFEQGLDENDQNIQPGMVFAYAALKAKAAYINFTPSVTAEIPALLEFAKSKGVPIAGKDGRTGQTLYKHVLGNMFKQRGLKLKGWYSTNILGNEDGGVLNNPKYSETKILSKSDGLEKILGYNDFDHRVRIDYFPLRGDQKEAWDTIDFEGWIGERMSMKINWLGSDSILAAPLIADLIRFMDHALEHHYSGVVGHVSLFFKSPYATNEYSLDNQYRKLLDYVNTFEIEEQ